MTKWLSVLLHSVLSAFRTRRDLAFESLLLRQQLAVLKENGSRPRLTRAGQFSAPKPAQWVLGDIVVGYITNTIGGRLRMIKREGHIHELRAISLLL